MPFDRSRYPDDWEEMRKKVLRRAENCCEGSPLYPWCNAMNGQPHPVTGSKVVLTIAHLDHDPEECRDLDRLRAWCQRCHLGYDRPRHIAKRRKNLWEKKACGDLFST